MDPAHSALSEGGTAPLHGLGKYYIDSRVYPVRERLSMSVFGARGPSLNVPEFMKDIRHIYRIIPVFSNVQSHRGYILWSFQVRKTLSTPANPVQIELNADFRLWLLIAEKFELQVYRWRPKLPNQISYLLPLKLGAVEEFYPHASAIAPILMTRHL